MKVKNISGAALTFKAGRRTHTKANNGITTVEEDYATLSDVITQVEAKRLEIVTPPAIAAYGGSPARAGFIELNLNSTLADADYVVVEGVTFEFDTAVSNSITAGRTRVLLDATAHATTAGALKTAINADTTLSALGIVADEIITVASDNAKLLIRATGSTALADVTITQSGDGVDIRTAVVAVDPVALRTSTVVVTATSATVMVDTGLESITGTHITVRTAAGVIKAYNGTVLYAGGVIFLNDVNTVDIASTDIVTITAFGK